jgi:hypothetical protein
MAQGWRTVRVFISSTFKDMQAERDHLVRFVFPRLREELLKRRIHLVDVDLRWGVTSEQDALSVCKEIIDECRPRFVCILGGRYGWMPPGKKESITAAEVHYAVLDRLAEQEYRFFYFRDPQATDAIPEDKAREDWYREFPLPEDIAQFGSDKAEALARERTARAVFVVVARFYSHYEKRKVTKMLWKSSLSLRSGKPLKVKPFTINADWRPVARAWGQED